ncbi:MAG: hypothetical protein IJL87_05380, partial [Clostridia bacterium]|nr:hypothetical protein [Clostridia bacterium]
FARKPRENSLFQLVAAAAAAKVVVAASAAVIVAASAAVAVVAACKYENKEKDPKQVISTEQIG